MNTVILTHRNLQVDFKWESLHRGFGNNIKVHYKHEIEPDCCWSTFNTSFRLPIRRRSRSLYLVPSRLCAANIGKVGAARSSSTLWV